MTNTIFSKIIRREIPATIVYEDEQCLAFNDINPQAPIHILLIPKKPLTRLADGTAEDQLLYGHLLLTAVKIAQAHGIGDSFRLLTNNGEAVGQVVFHLHFHIVGDHPLQTATGLR